MRGPKNSWLPEKEKMLIENVRFDQRGFVCNVPELQKLLKEPKKAIDHKVRQLRNAGVLEKIYWADPIEPIRKEFSCWEDSKIIYGTKIGRTAKEIAKDLDRTTKSVYGRQFVLRKAGKLDSYNKINFSEYEDQMLIENLEFDEFGYALNLSELSRMLHRSKKSICNRIYFLRKQQRITVYPDHSRTNKKAAIAMKKFRDRTYPTKIAYSGSRRSKQ